MAKNPLLLSKKNINLYVLVWVTIIVAHSGILCCFYTIPVEWALLDSLIFNGSFAGMAISLWYTVRYFNIDKTSISVAVANHLVAGTFFLLVWLNLGYYAIEALNQESVVYMEFHSKSKPWRFFFGLFYYCITVLVYYLFLYYESYKQKQLNEAELQTLVKETELNLLKSQLNPHFIFNSLNSISALTMSNPACAQEMVIKLSSYIRYALKQDRSEQVSFAEELENSKLYLQIEKVRFGNRLVFEETCAQESLQAKVPNMILQPLLENAIKHGVYESLEPVKITIESQLERELLEVVITNTFDPDAKTARGNGIGLKNVKQRLALLYGLRDLVQISATSNIFEIRLYIPQPSIN